MVEARKTISKDITSYDLLKALAVLLMVVDHVGHYFYPDIMGLRLIGRLSVPIWFFLIGYSQRRDVPRRWLVGGAVLVFSNFIIGQYIFPLNILFSLAIARWWVDGTVMRALRGREALTGMFFLLFLCSFPSMGIVEYGTVGLLFTMMGAFRRHKEGFQLRRGVLFLFIMGSIFAYLFTQIVIVPPVSWAQGGGLLSGMIVICGLLFVFEPRTYPRLTSGLGPLSSLVRFVGRWTLEIYVVHLLFFRGLAMWLDPERFRFLEFQIAPAGFLSMFTAQ